MLNLSFESIFDATPGLFSGILVLYLFTFTIAGIFLSLFLLFIRFLYKKKIEIKPYLRVKTDFLFMTGFVILYSICLRFYQDKLFHTDIEIPVQPILAFGLFFFCLAILSLYFQKKIFTIPLYAIRVLLLIAIVPVFIYQVSSNVSLFFQASGEENAPLPEIAQKQVKDLNILLITIDTCRADKLSCYGHRKPTSPNIDALADQGFIFEKAFSASNWTKPATASLFTSLYPSTHQTNTLVQRLPETLQCLPERFKAAGYHTAVISDNANISPDFGFHQGTDYFFETSRKSMTLFSILYMRLTQLSPSLGIRLNRLNRRDRITIDTTHEEVMYSRFLEWIERIGYKKFFANIHFNTPHGDYDPPPEYDIFAEDTEIEVPRAQPAFGSVFSKQQIQRLLSLYCGEIGYVDYIIGKIIKELRKTGLLEKTIIVITSDHGEEFYDHKSWGHSHTMYNELLYIPMIFYIPDHPDAPARIQNYVSILDIGPTLMSLVGLPDDPYLDGKNLTPLLEGSPNGVHDFIFAESLSPKDTVAKFMIISDGFKYIEYNYRSRKMGALFNLKKDFEEKRRLPIHRVPGSQKIKNQLAEMKKYVLSKKTGSRQTHLSAEKKEQLRELGYIQ